jgi:hypothetical protein
MPVTISQWSVTADRRLSFSPVGGLIGRPLPHRLEAGESAAWLTDATEIQAMVHATQQVLNVAPGGLILSGRVELGDGRVVTGAQDLRAMTWPSPRPRAAAPIGGVAGATADAPASM